MEKTLRSSNFELLRIVAMLLIILNHACQYGISIEDASFYQTNFCLSKIFYIWTGNLGNWLFIMTSGYFLSKSKFSWKKFFNMWAQVLFFSVLIGTIIYVFKLPVYRQYNDLNQLYEFRNISLREYVESFFPVILGKNWFATAYLVFYLFIPFLNKSLDVLDKELHARLIILMSLLGTVLNCIPKQAIIQTNYLFYFILGYYIASYIRIYEPKFLSKNKNNLIISGLLILMFIIWEFLLCKLRLNSSYQILTNESTFYKLLSIPIATNRFPILICSIFLFSFFKNLNIRYSVLINTFASSCFSVYLIHENPLFNNFMWKKLLFSDYFSTSKFLPLWMLLTPIIVFLFSFPFEVFRKYIFQIIGILYKHIQLKFEEVREYENK